METSYNGWTASPNPKDFGGITPLVIAGESFAPGVRTGDVHTVLSYVFQQFHDRVEPIWKPGWHDADDWGYNYRQNRNANNLSCHASATAGDANATRHPNGKRGTFTPDQVREIKRILAEVDNVVEWGGNFTGTPDEMHFEIKGNAAKVGVVANRLRNNNPIPGTTYPIGGARTLVEGMTGGDVWEVANFFNTKFPVYSKIPLDANRAAQRYGPVTIQVVKEFQSRSKLVADGVLGPNTYSEMAKYGYK